MTTPTDHLTKLTCAAREARDFGYVHTGRALEKLISEERERLMASHLVNADASFSSQLVHGHGSEET
jgi:hypothetical protein